MATDSSGQQAVDFVWGALPVQPNDDRAATISNIGGSTGDYGWSATTQVASGRLNPALDNHANVEAHWAGYPGYTPAAGNFIVTAATGDGTTVTYTSQNFLTAGTSVVVSGLSVNGFNGTQTVVKATSTYFTTTNSTTGTITGQTGKVEAASAAGDADGVGLGNILVPNVLGATLAFALDALKDAGYEAGNITTAAAATNAAKTVTAIARSAASHNLVFTASGAGAAYAVGTKVVVSGFSNSDAFLNGTYTVTDKATNTFTVYTTATDAVSLSGKSGAVVGVEGTIKTQSTAGNATATTSASITITPWAAAS
jgi:hypothetical protein